MFYVWQMNDGRWHVSPLGGRPGFEIIADQRLIWEFGFDCGFDTRGMAEAAHKQLCALSPTTEPTEQGNQYVIPGCEKDRSRGPDQADMF